MNKPKDYDKLNDRESRKEYLRNKLPEFIESVSTKDPAHRGFYACLNKECRDSEHVHSTSGSLSIAGDRKHFKCFSCGIGGDIFDAVGYVYNLDDFKEQYDKACETFGLDPEFTVPDDEKPEAAPEPEKASETVQDKEESDPDTEGKFKEYLVKCNGDCVEGSKGYEYLKGRGFTAETIKRFMLGYDSAKDCVTIPYNMGFSYYGSRSLETHEGGHKYNKPPKAIAGSEPLFNQGALFTDRFCFVCEGQLDAISIMQGGGTAVALGGSNIQKLLKMIENKKPNHCLILCFDNDKVGADAQKHAAKTLEESGVSFIEARFSWDQYEQFQKDCNDLLRSNADLFNSEIHDNIRSAKEYELEVGSGFYSVGEYKDIFKKHMTMKKQRISTGYNSLDRALFGGFTNELYILSAETSVGKSAITVNLAQNIAASGIYVLYYALEMGQDEFIARGASMISREHNDRPIPFGSILNHEWDDKSREFYRRPYNSYASYVDEYMERYGKHLYFKEGGFYGKTALGIAEDAENFKKERDLNQLVIVVDYLQRLKADPDDRSQRDAMSITSAAVQVLGNLASQKHNTVIAISSISNAQKGQRVTDAAGKYSGDISYTGGILLGWNWEGYTNTTNDEKKAETQRLCKERGYREMTLEVLKQRSGERDKKLTMFYYPAYNYFTAPDIDGAKSVQPRRR